MGAPLKPEPHPVRIAMQLSGWPWIVWALDRPPERLAKLEGKSRSKAIAIGVMDRANNLTPLGQKVAALLKETV